MLNKTLHKIGLCRNLLTISRLINYIYFSSRSKAVGLIYFLRVDFQNFTKQV